MDRLQGFLSFLKAKRLAQGNFLGLLYVLIGRSIADANGDLISKGLTWRELSVLLQKVRWERDAVKELDIDPDELPPRDRQRFWFVTFARAGLDSKEAAEAGKRMAKVLEAEGYQVGSEGKKKEP
jgi:hypothetical protein